jgi:hypothetical protein
VSQSVIEREDGDDLILIYFRDDRRWPNARQLFLIRNLMC